jgi:hypothetical protein
MMYDSIGGLTRSGSLEIPNFNIAGTYSQFVCTIDSVSNNPSTKLIIYMYLSDDQTLIQGRWFQLDDIALSAIPTSIDEKSDRSFNVRTENQQLILTNKKTNFYYIDIYSLDGRLLENVFQGELNQGEFSFFGMQLKRGNILSIRSNEGKGYSTIIRN